MTLRAAFSVLVVGLVAIACNSTTQDDALYPSCNGNSAEGLVTESTPAGQCPTHPTSLVGKATVGAQCSDSTDCAPYCCQCTNGQGALAALCANGSCLDGGNTCCLYSKECSN